MIGGAAVHALLGSHGAVAADRAWSLVILAFAYLEHVNYVYSEAQAERGDSTYKRLCARCHMENLAGSDESVELTGSAFVGSWSGQSLTDLHDRIRTTMPTDTPGVYGRQEIVDVTAYMLR